MRSSGMKIKMSCWVCFFANTFQITLSSLRLSPTIDYNQSTNLKSIFDDESVVRLWPVITKLMHSSRERLLRGESLQSVAVGPLVVRKTRDCEVLHARVHGALSIDVSGSLQHEATVCRFDLAWETSHLPPLLEEYG